MGFFQNTRKPEGVGGKIMVKMMNSGHSRVAKWGFSKISPKGGAKILDIGCGGGANIALWLKASKTSNVKGLDYSEISVSATRKLNKDAMEEGRCQVIQGDVSEMPFSDEEFDYISAFETVYFWPGLEDCFREVLRVLKRGGTFMIVNEANGLNESQEKWTGMIGGMTIYKGEQIVKSLEKAGFKNVRTHTEKKKPWICILAEKE